LEDWLVSLIRLHVLQLSEFAARLDVALPNLMAALSGRRPLPEKCRRPMFDLLGLDDQGRLRSDRNYCLNLRDNAYLDVLLAKGLGSMRLAHLGDVDQVRTSLSGSYWLWDSPTAGNCNVVGVLKASPEAISEFAKSHFSSVEVLPNIEVHAPPLLFDQAIPSAAISALLVVASAGRTPRSIGWRETISLADAMNVKAEDVFNWIKSKQ
jgi:hypothetical protein